jgi:WhiB family transcriptional regulator, redox-sensing transcriptional regulator
MAMSETAVDRAPAFDWRSLAICHGHSGVFFAPAGERPEAREDREDRARVICHRCPVMMPCRTWAREQREYGFWGGESEEERAAAGFRVEMPVGRIALYPRGKGEPVEPRPARRDRIVPGAGNESVTA